LIGKQNKAEEYANTGLSVIAKIRADRSWRAIATRTRENGITSLELIDAAERELRAVVDN